MFEIIFYKDKNGKSEIVEYLDKLKKEGETNKSARINREKILLYLAVLSECGTRIGSPYVKHIYVCSFALFSKEISKNAKKRTTESEK